jgi:hypothetical protein
MNVIDQIRVSAQRGNRLALIVGLVLGAFVPTIAFSVTHEGIDTSHPLWLQVNTYIVLACLAYSATTVWSWMRSVTKSRVKATGFCVMIELTMVCSGLYALSVACLVLLIGINAVATGAILALDQKEAKEAAKKTRPVVIKAKVAKTSKVTRITKRTSGTRRKAA